MIRKRNRSYTDEQFIEAVATSYSIAEVLRKLELCHFGSTYRAFHILVRKLKLDTGHFTGQLWSKGKKAPNNGKATFSLEEILVENSPHSGGSRLKSRLLNAGILQNKCEICGVSDWLDKPLVLHMDHINGINTDQRRENLRMLCPNCHSQTDTYCGKNAKRSKLVKITKIKLKPKYTKLCICGKLKSLKAINCPECSAQKAEKITWPSDIELKELVWKYPTTQLAEKLGVSDTAIDKRCRSRGIIKPGRGYWTKKAKHPGVAELLDATGSNPVSLRGVEVGILSSGPF